MYLAIEDTELLRRIDVLADEVYRLVRMWDAFDRETIGIQLVRAVDSIGANLVEGDGRRSEADSIRFFRYSRSSAREARWWIRRVGARKIESVELCAQMTSELTECVKMINGLIRYRVNTTVKESRAPYNGPFANDFS